jgi:hypothetical protein
MRIEGEPQPLHPSVDHPFWVKRGDAKDGAHDGNWLEAAKMQPGDLLLTVQGRWVKVLSITPLGEQTVYNFTVDEDHDYYVGTSGLLVHKAGACNWRQAEESLNETYGGEQQVSMDTTQGAGGLAQGERSPTVLCPSIRPVHDEDGRIVQITGRSAGVNEDVNLRAELARGLPAL